MKLDVKAMAFHRNTHIVLLGKQSAGGRDFRPFGDRLRRHRRLIAGWEIISRQLSDGGAPFHGLF